MSEPLLPQLAAFEPLLVAAARRRVVRRRVRRLSVVALAVLGGGTALAAGSGPFSGVGSADRPLQDSDALPAPLLQTIAADQAGVTRPAWDQVGTVGYNQARLLGSFPGGWRVYAVPSAKGKLCAMAVPPGGGAFDACGDALDADHPASVLLYRASESAAPVAVGVTLDGVTGVTFRAAGETVKVPVVGNAFVWQAPHAGATPSRFAARFADGRVVPLR